MSYAFAQLPLLKILLHAAKHPTCTINGMLLGSAQGSGAEAAVHVTDVVPLFHASCNLAAPTEMALAQIDAFTQQPGSKASMVGYYHADARMQPPAELPPAGKKVADKLGAKLPAAFMLLLDAKRLAQFSAGGEACQPFELVTKDGSRGWRRDPTATISLAQGSWKDLQAEFLTLYKRGRFALLVDFDDHLDDLQKDWLNPDIVGKFALPGQL